MKNLLLSAALLLCAPVWIFGQSSPTVVADTIVGPGGTNPTGTIILTWQRTLNNANPRQVIFPGTQAVQVTSGVFSVSLFPNDAMLPVSTCYSANYNGLGGVNAIKYWRVPTSPAPVNLQQVEGSQPCPTQVGAIIAPAQITPGAPGITQFLSSSPTGYVSWVTGGGGGGGTPGGFNGQLQYNNFGSFGGFTIGGDCSLTLPILTCTKTGGVPFAPSATINALNATNINSGVLNTLYGGTGATSLSGAGIALTANPLSQFATTTSAQVFGIISNPTGTGQLVFNNSPTFVNPALGTPASAIGTNFTGIPLGTAVIGVLPQQFGGTGISNTASLTLGTANHNYASLGTGLIKNTTVTGALSNAASSDVFGLWTGVCSSSTFLRGDGQCAAPAGAGTVTHTAGPLTLNAVIVGNGAGDVAALNSLGTLGYVLTSTGPSTPPNWQPAASSSGGYNFCASGCSTTVPSSGTTIAAATHLQGVSAWAMAADSSGHEMTSPNFLVTRDSSGDLTFTYVTAPSYIAIMGAGSGGGGGGGGVGWSANGSLIGTSALSNFTSSSGITLTGTFPSSVFTLNVAPDTTVLQTKANLQTGTCPNCLVSASGSPTVYTASATPALGSYSTNSTFRWTVDVTNTTTGPTLAVNGLSAITVFNYLGAALTVGALSGGSTYTITYNGTKFLCAECGIVSSVPSTGSQTQYLQVTPNTGNTTTYQWNGLPTVNPADYNYSVTPTSPSTLTAGSRTITLAICPLGIFSGSTWSSVYLTAGSGGAAEAVTPASGTCSAATLGQAGGTIVVTIANSHGSGYLVQSATAGFQEAVLAQQSTAIAFSGTVNWQTGISLPSGHPGIFGVGPNANITLLYNSGNGITVVAGGFSTRLANFSIAPNSGVMTSGALIFNSTNGAGIILEDLNVGLNGLRDAYIGVQHAAPLYATNVYEWAVYRGFISANEIHFDIVHVSSSSTTGNVLANSAALYITLQTGGVVKGFSHDAGVLTNCVVADSSSSAVNELSFSDFYCDHFMNYSFYTPSSSNPVQGWQITNFRIEDNSGNNNGTCFSLGASATNWSISNGQCGYWSAGAVFSGSSYLTMTGTSIYPKGNSSSGPYGQGPTAIGIDTAANHIKFGHNFIGIGPENSGTVSKYGIVDNAGSGSSTNIDIFDNNIQGSTGTVQCFNSCAGLGWNVWNNTGIDDTWQTVASATTINLASGNWATKTYITGTTTTTTLNFNSGAPQSGRTIILNKSDVGSLTIGGGGNIPLAHTLVQHSTITLTYDGVSAIWN